MVLFWLQSPAGAAPSCATPRSLRPEPQDAAPEQTQVAVWQATGRRREVRNREQEKRKGRQRTGKGQGKRALQDALPLPPIFTAHGPPQALHEACSPGPWDAEYSKAFRELLASHLKDASTGISTDACVIQMLTRIHTKLKIKITHYNHTCPEMKNERGWFLNLLNDDKKNHLFMLSSNPPAVLRGLVTWISQSFCPHVDQDKFGEWEGRSSEY